MYYTNIISFTCYQEIETFTTTRFPPIPIRDPLRINYLEEAQDVTQCNTITSDVRLLKTQEATATDRIKSIEDKVSSLSENIR